MPRKRRSKQASLGNKRKKGRYMKKANEENHDINIREYSENGTGQNKSTENGSFVVNEDEGNEESSNSMMILQTNQTDYDDDDDEIREIAEDRTTQEIYFMRQKNLSQRWTVFHLFVHKYNGMDAPGGDYLKHWSGRGGIVSSIRRDLGWSVHNGTKLIPIFEKIMECIRTETDFSPDMVDNRRGHKELTIRLDSPEAQIIADGLESGLSLSNTWKNVNRHREDNELPLVSESCVSVTLRKMKPKMVRIKKRKQGSTDPESLWAKARYEWSTQLLVRFGKLNVEELPRPVEKRFYRSSVGELEIQQVVWWDETHRKCLIGGSSTTKDYQMLFMRNSDGKINLENGEYSSDIKTRLNVKYEKECRLGLGCAVIQPLAQDDTPLPNEGVRCHPFDYSGKVIIGFDDYQKMMDLEIRRVKSLSSERLGFWVESGREPDKLYREDSVIKLKQCGNAAAKKLETVGITKVGDLMDIKVLVDFVTPEKMSKNVFRKFWLQAKEAIDAPIPPTIDHRKAGNPPVKIRS